MSSLLPGLILSLLAGAIIAAQAPIYTRISQGLGSPLQTTLLAFSTAVCVLVVLMGVTRTDWPRLEAMRALPIWVWVGGVLGICVVLLSIAAVPRLGIAGYIAAMICGQLAASIAFDHWGVFGLVQRGIGWQGLAGVALIALGAGLVVFRP